MNRTITKSMLATILGFACMLVSCQSPRPITKHPPGTLPVRYEEATTYSACLVASVAMASNYLLDRTKFSTDGILQEMKQADLDETRVGDVKRYLAGQDLYLVTLTGTIDGKPPTGLNYWLTTRGYPVICVINHEGENPAFNHAVVVIGISANLEEGSTDRIHYFDPSAEEPLQSVDRATFEPLWSRGQHAMMIVVMPASKPPAASASNPAGNNDAQTGFSK